MDDASLRPPAEDCDFARSDDALLGLIRAGDEGALRELYERHAPWLAVRLRRTPPASAFEDVLQETFLAPTGATSRGLARLLRFSVRLPQLARA